METGRRNNPGVAAVLSFFFNGLGQVYNGQIYKGLVFMAFSMIGMLAITVSSVFIAYWFFKGIPVTPELKVSFVVFCLGVVIVAALGIYSILDAYKAAGKR